ncbi:MAG: hypothetical protein WAM60_18075 [Candidatus Promineifilaceae bacterium]
MDNDKSFLGRISEWLQGLVPTGSPRQTDPQVDVDNDGFFFYIACDNCDDHLRLRVRRSYDLEREEGGGYSWRKTIVDGRCFRKMEARVLFDNAYQVIQKEIEGGRFVGREEWEAHR